MDMECCKKLKGDFLFWVRSHEEGECHFYTFSHVLQSAGIYGMYTSSSMYVLRHLVMSKNTHTEAIGKIIAREFHWRTRLDCLGAFFEPIDRWTRPEIARQSEYLEYTSEMWGWRVVPENEAVRLPGEQGEQKSSRSLPPAHEKKMQVTLAIFPFPILQPVARATNGFVLSNTRIKTGSVISFLKGPTHPESPKS